MEQLDILQARESVAGEQQSHSYQKPLVGDLLEQSSGFPAKGFSMNSGWIKIHRKMTEWEWYSDIIVCRVFMHLLLTANHEEGNWKGVKIGIGQLAIGRKMLSKNVGISEQSLRTALTKLKSTSEITIKSTTKYSVITILKWNDYQQATSKSTNEQPTINQQLTTNKKIRSKEVKKDIYTSEFEKFWSLYPKKVGKQKSSTEWGKINKTEHEKIYEDIPKRKEDDKWVNGFVKDPERYLKSRQWEDEILKPRGSEGQEITRYKD